MARPKKDFIDYFPHYCEHGKTLFIIESAYGNDGYAFFYKLLERLGRARGHFIDCRNPEDWEYLLAKTNMSGEIAQNILAKLASMGKIDADLWAMKVIWMQTFVDSIADVYKNRRIEPPPKPSFYEPKPPSNDISTDHNPQSKVNESKVNKSKVKIENTPAAKIKYFDAVYLTDQEYQKLLSKYGRDPTQKAIEILNNGIMSKGYKYKSHYHTIIGWPMKEAQGNGNKTRPCSSKPGTGPGTGATFTKTGRAESDGQPYPIDFEG